MLIKRKSGIELLRVVLMIMIIGLHYLNGYMGGALEYTNEGTFNWYLIRFLESMFIIAVDCFIIINGYFMVSKKSVNLRKIIKLFLELSLYNVIIYLLCLALEVEKFQIINFIRAVFPLLINNYWFFKYYIVLFLLIPFINILLNNIDKETYKKLLIVILLVFSLWDSIMPNKIIVDSGYGIVNFVVLYVIGGYLKLHYNNSNNFSYWGIRYMLFSLVTFISLFIPVIRNNSWSYYFITNIFSAICLFNAFNKVNIKSNIINTIASSVFGVFILHLNPYILNFQYKIAKTNLFWNSKFMILHMTITCVAIFSIFVFVDILRKKLFDKVFNNIINGIKVFNIEV